MKKAILAFVGASFMAGAVPARAQQILLEPVRAGELVLFRDLTNDKAYYYVSDKPRLALQEDGNPYFSFLRWVQNVRTGATEAERREGDGGGIVHALVTLAVTQEQIREAQADLQRVKPGGRVVGPVMWDSGTVALISAIKDPNGKMIAHIDGLTAAPILDGQKSAFSVLLSKLGSQILWDTFQTPTPAVAFAYEMKLKGFRPPMRAILEANFDQIYKHKAFNAGITHKYFAIDIQAAFDDLRRQGAIKLTEIGDDAKLHSLIQDAYTKISAIMFQNADDILKPVTLPAAGGADPLAGVASRLSAHVTKATDAARQDPRGPQAIADAQAAKQVVERLEGELKPLQDTLAAARAALNESEAKAKADKEAADKLKAKAEKGDEAAKAALAEAEQTAAASEGSQAGGASAVEAAQAAVTAKQNELDAARKKHSAAADTAEEFSGRPPALGILASFQMKKFRQSGTLRVDLNKYTESTIVMPFAGNISDVRQYKDAFRRVNLDDPLYQQREIVVSLAGIDADDFGPYLNFVTVRLRKKHAKGAETHDEVLIDKKTFTDAGNRFKLLYGWKDDDDRRRWMDYEYQTVWNFAGGKTIETPLQKANAQAIPAVSPYERRAVELQADAADLAKAEVRSLTVKLFYSLAGAPQVKIATLDAAKLHSTRIEYFSAPETVDYDYEITWRLKGNRTVSSGRQKGAGSILAVDEVPPAVAGQPTTPAESASL
jgi:hypothetical protein